MTSLASARLVSRTGDDVVFEGIHINGCVSGLLLEVSAEQRFRNTSSKHLEVVYTFPLPAGAVMLGMEVRLGERQLSSMVVEKSQATRQYEDSVADGDLAIMLEKNHDDSYCLNLGNLGPGEACVLTLRYAETLRFEQRGLRVCIPTVIAPRYGSPIRDAGLAPHQVTAHDITSHHPFSLTLRLPPAFAPAQIGSPSHKITTQTSADGITVSLLQAAALDRDFVLAVERLAHDSLAIAAADGIAPGQAAALASFCPRITSATPVQLRAKLLVDCSGSMAGDSIQAARRAIESIIGQFQPGDRFSLSRFGSSVQHRARPLWTASGRTRLAAQRWARALEADLGGTEMEQALESTFALGSAIPGDVLLITDGQIHAIEQVIATARATGQRVFIVAIGASPAESHLRRLAEATNGACDFIAAGERVEPAVLRMFARLRSPRLEHLRVEWQCEPRPVWASTRPSAVFDGDTVNLYASFNGLPQAGEVVLYGRDGDQAEQEIGRATIGRATIGRATIGRATIDIEAGGTPVLARLAAYARAASPLVPGGPDPDQLALDLALNYQFVTHRTNLLLVHQRAAANKASDMPQLHKVAQMLPAGWSGTGTVRASIDTGFHAPAIFRRSGPADDMMVNQGATAYDIPAFLRKACGDVSLPGGYVKRRGRWSDTTTYQGLTPLGLHELLRSTPKSLWDNCYDGLRASGLGAEVVDWLEFVVGATAGEAEVVAAFQYVMALDATRATLLTSRGGPQAYKAAALKLLQRVLPAGRPVAAPAGVDADLAAHIAAMLATISATTWPAWVFALEAPAGEAAARTPSA